MSFALGGKGYKSAKYIQEGLDKLINRFRRSNAKLLKDSHQKEIKWLLVNKQTRTPTGTQGI